MYVIVAASVDANRILVDEERLILAARCFSFSSLNSFRRCPCGSRSLGFGSYSASLFRSFWVLVVSTLQCGCFVFLLLCVFFIKFGD